jgi:hypothetical protein
MAKPIRNTPELFGKDAKQFNAQFSSLPKEDERKRERERIVNNINRLMELTNNK